MLFVLQTGSTWHACQPWVVCAAVTHVIKTAIVLPLSVLQTWVHMAAAPGTEAVSLAAVNTVGKAGGFLGPLSFGLILHATGTVHTAGTYE
jgi:hypothetical protein